jgi:hypothetical protein
MLTELLICGSLVRLVDSFARLPSNAILPFQETIFMPLFEIETSGHIVITWADDEPSARQVVADAFPSDDVIRMTKRPRDTWVISKGALGLTSVHLDPCGIARECLSKSSGDKIHAIRLYMHETGSDLEQARKVIESNMVMGW